MAAIIPRSAGWRKKVQTSVSEHTWKNTLLLEKKEWEGIRKEEEWDKQLFYISHLLFDKMHPFASKELTLIHLTVATNL